MCHEWHQGRVEGDAHLGELVVAELEDDLPVADAVTGEVRDSCPDIAAERAEETREERGEPAQVVVRRGAREVFRRKRRGAGAKDIAALDRAARAALDRLARPRLVCERDDAAPPEHGEMPVERGRWDVRHPLEELRRGHRHSRTQGDDQAHPDRMQDEVGPGGSGCRRVASLLIHDNEKIIRGAPPCQAPITLIREFAPPSPRSGADPRRVPRRPGP